MNMTTRQKHIPTLRFPEFNGEWNGKKLGNIAEFTSSKRVYLSDYVDQGIPFYRGKEISELRLGIKPSDILYITEKRYEDFKKKYGVPLVNDILITAVGTLGNVLKINNDDKFYFKDGNLIWLRKIKEDAGFLEILLQWHNRDLIKTSIGSTQKALTMVELRKITFPFPSTREQQKIASFLSSIDTKIEQLGKKISLLEQYKKGMMQKLFSQEIRFKDEHGSDYPDWENKHLSDVGKIVGGGTPDTKNSNFWNGDINWFTPTEIKSKYVMESRRTITEFGLKKSSARLLPIGTILFSSRATVGDLAISTTECTTNQGFQSLIIDDNTHSNEFIYYWIIINKNEFLRRANGSTFLEISKSEIKKIAIRSPTREEQQKIADFLSAIDKKIKLVSTELELAQTFKKGLLQQMFI